mmetsp:Transcript_17031/g.48914  ORF Transcript_17031/g.48914 Transcript_17031/m.48914 type:complete len:630 (-) Transcript_17031:33-1922(-)
MGSTRHLFIVFQSRSSFGGGLGLLSLHGLGVFDGAMRNVMRLLDRPSSSGPLDDDPLEADLIEGSDALVAQRGGLALRAKAVQLALMIHPLSKLGVRGVLLLASPDAAVAVFLPEAAKLLVVVVPLLALLLAVAQNGLLLLLHLTRGPGGERRSRSGGLHERADDTAIIDAMLQDPMELEVLESLDALVGHRRGLAIPAKTVELALMVAPLPELGVRLILALPGPNAGIAGLGLVLLELLVALIPLLGLRLAMRGGAGRSAAVSLLGAATAGGRGTDGRLVACSSGSGGLALRAGVGGLLATGDRPLEANLLEGMDPVIGEGSLLALIAELVHLPLTVDPLAKRAEGSLTDLAGPNSAVAMLGLVLLEILEALLPGSAGRDERLELEVQLLEGSDALAGHGGGLPGHPGLPILALLADPQPQSGGVLLGDVGVAVVNVVAPELLEPLVPAAVLVAGGRLAAAGVELPIEGDGFEQLDALVVHGGGLALGPLAVGLALSADPPAELRVVLDGDVARALLGLPQGELGEAVLPRGVALALLAEGGTASAGGAGPGTGRDGLGRQAALGGLRRGLGSGVVRIPGRLGLPGERGHVRRRGIAGRVAVGGPEGRRRLVHRCVVVMLWGVSEDLN